MSYAAFVYCEIVMANSSQENVAEKNGFGWIWLDLGRFGWFWVVLAGFGLSCILISTLQTTIYFTGIRLYYLQK